MGRFEVFYTGEKESDLLNQDLVKVSDTARSGVKNRHYVSRQERVWAIDYEKCSTKEDYRRYIDKYQRYPSNLFVAKARKEFESILEDEELELEAQQNHSNQEHGYNPSHAVQSATGTSCYAGRSVVNNSKWENDPYLILRIIGTILLFAGAVFLTMVINISGWTKGLAFLGCTAIGKWIWNEDF